MLTSVKFEIYKRAINVDIKSVLIGMRSNDHTTTFNIINN